MLLLLTGSSGLLGSAVLEYLLKDGHSVVGVDVRPSQRRPPKGPSRFTDYTMDLSDYWRLDKIFETHNFDGVVHLSAIPSPIGLDGRMVHNVNVTTTYNVLATAARHGVKRLVQASSVNAIGLAFTPVDRLFLPRFPITEQASYQDMDPYALSKHICEMQAECLARADPTLRIASLRLHMIRPDYPSAVPDCHRESFYSWVSTEACARACLLGLVSTGWGGAETFNIVAPQICRENTDGTLPGTADLFDSEWDHYTPGNVEVGWFAGDRRRSVWDCSKADRLLGWRHEV